MHNLVFPMLKAAAELNGIYERIVSSKNVNLHQK